MKKNIIFYVLLLSVLLVACGKDENLEPSNLGKDWFVVEDDVNDLVTHAIYQFYKETGIPVFYNDTIGRETRVDNWGNSYTYYETLSVNYALGGVAEAGGRPSVSSYVLCPKEYVLDGLEFLKTDVIPVIPENVGVHSFLLLDSLTSWGFGYEAFKGLNTILVSRMTKLNGMSEKARKSLRGAVIRSILSVSVLAYEDELATFYKITRNHYTTEDLYGYNAWYFTSRTPYDDPKEVGFLDKNPRNMAILPTESMDVNMYLEAIFSNTESEFMELYGAYEPIMKKYEIIKSILQDIGVSI